MLTYAVRESNAKNTLPSKRHILVEPIRIMLLPDIESPITLVRNDQNRLLQKYCIWEKLVRSF